MTPHAITHRLREVARLRDRHPDLVTRRLREVALLRNLCLRLAQARRRRRAGE